MIPALVALAVACGLPDRGIFPELDAKVSMGLPPLPAPGGLWLRLDRGHGVLTLYAGDDPLKAYPVAAAATVGEGRLGDLELHAGDLPRPPERGVRLREGDLAEIRGGLDPATPVLLAAPDRDEDRDGDGVVDRLDFVLGGKKLVQNRARYIERYVGMKYPGGDVPRSEGVCTDTVVRALRNGGLDLQREVHEDIVRARRAYSMVEKVDTNINHRRVRTVLPWFLRHWRTLPEGTPHLPGDVVFFDTFPSRTGPDHLGVVVETRGPSGRPMVVNNWTDGTVDAEMDLLSWVPVTHHFRAPARPARRPGQLSAPSR